jgi:preprotein translocase subunit SecA
LSVSLCVFVRRSLQQQRKIIFDYDDVLNKQRNIIIMKKE